LPATNREFRIKNKAKVAQNISNLYKNDKQIEKISHKDVQTRMEFDVTDSLAKLKEPQ